MYKKLALLALLVLLISPASAHYYYDTLRINPTGSTPAGDVATSGVATVTNLSAWTRFNEGADYYYLVCNSSMSSGTMAPFGYSVLAQTSAGPGTVGYTFPSSCQDGLFDTVVSHDNGWLIVASWAHDTLPVNVTFIVSESGNFTHKLDGVTVTSSSGTSGVTDINGSVTLAMAPPASTYTYTAVKTGYVDATGDISVTGTYGGTIYFQMVPGAGSSTARTYLHAIDSLTGAHIGGSTISAKCNTNGTWQNSTTSTGMWYIDCANTDTFNIYGSATGYTDASDTNVAAGGSYYLSLLPSGAAAPVGYTNVYVSVIDGYSSTPLTYATVTAALSSGSTTGDNTGSSGTVKFVLANNSVVIITASKSGYTSLSKSLNTGPGVDIHTLITLSKTTVPSSTVTPIVTDPSTGEVITPQPTYLPYCDPNDPYYSLDECRKSQDSSFMAKIREWAPTILDLAIAAILFGLLAAIFGAMQKMTKW